MTPIVETDPDVQKTGIRSYWIRGPRVLDASAPDEPRLSLLLHPREPDPLDTATHRVDDRIRNASSGAAQMITRATIRFWGEGVGCFCHEAVTRALCDAFGEVSISDIDVAYAKYRRAAEYPALENSVWYELLRNGPAFTFTLPSGIFGRFSRYSIDFDIPDTADPESVAQITRFLDQLSLGRIERD